MRYCFILLYLLVPPILGVYAVYRPLFGRRDALKILWLMFVATLYTTPWDNFIIASGGWSYPPSSILALIYHVPLEEHLFFVLQPTLVILLHSLITLPVLVPFRIPARPRRTIRIAAHEDVAVSADGKVSAGPVAVDVTRTVQTLARRPGAALLWLAPTALGAWMAYESHATAPEHTRQGLGAHGFYLGYILVWICPVIAALTWIGARLGKRDLATVAVSTAYLWGVDTAGIRSGAWSISLPTSTGVMLWRGLPCEEAIFFLLTNVLIVLASSLIAHLHALQLIAAAAPASADNAALPACPPANLVGHCAVLARLTIHPPEVDERTLDALVRAEDTLKKGSKSFDLAKLAFGREIRIGLVGVYAWCRVTDNLIDETPTAPGAERSTRLAILSAIRQHLHAAYAQPTPSSSALDAILETIPSLTDADRSAFHLFAALVPRLVPVEPFLELCDGYETDIAFYASAEPSAITRQTQITLDPETLPIKTSKDLLTYADNVAGSVASAICYLSWAVLAGRRVPALSGTAAGAQAAPGLTAKEARTVAAAREMGRALQLVNIARDVVKDARIGRVYVPLSTVTPAQLLSLLDQAGRDPDADADAAAPAVVDLPALTLPLLDQAEVMRLASEGEIAHLPRTARGGARAMAASYFEIAAAVRRDGGVVDARGVRVSKATRAWAAARAMWF
ncbi:hypothetical protein Q5752_001785 [Cryptotrichosporon argae]